MSLKILVIDDEEDILKIIQCSLESQEGFVVKCVNSGEEALREAQKFQPDFILLDFLMPGMDGVATYKAFQNIPALAQIPVVILTAFSDETKTQELLSLGIADVIIKPFDPWNLPSQIRSILTRYQQAKKNHG